MMELISFILICTQISDDYAFLDELIFYESRMGDTDTVKVTSYFLDSTKEPVPWRQDNSGRVQYKSTDKGLVLIDLPYEQVVEDEENLSVDEVTGVVKYVINTNTLKYKTEFIDSEAGEKPTSFYGYCVNGQGNRPY